MNVPVAESLEAAGGKSPGAVLQRSPFLPSDGLAAMVTFLLALFVYLATLAPSVTLEDSGELVTGAALFGVPHPPGYPLWSLSGFVLTQLLPFGNYAWRINLLSAIYGAGASAVLAVLVASSGRWLILGARRGSPGEWLNPLSLGVGIGTGLILAFSLVMWSQAVIAEVYTLNALFLTLTLLCFYRWMADPDQERWLLAGVFVFALGLTNHHTLLSALPAFLLAAIFAKAPELRRWDLLALLAGCGVAGAVSGQVVPFMVPVFLIGLWRIRSPFFPSFFIGFCLLCLTTFAVLAWYSGSSQLRLICVRVAYLVLIGCGVISFWFVREPRIRPFLGGACLAMLIGGAASHFLGEWFSLTNGDAWWLLILAAVMTGLLATSQLRFDLVLAIVILGWAGLMPYAYMPFASSTNPPMNWGFASKPGGFYNAINRTQYGGSSLSQMIINLADRAGIAKDPERSTTENASKSVSKSIQEKRAVFEGILHYIKRLRENFTSNICVFPVLLIPFLATLSPSGRHWMVFLGLAFLLLAFVQSILEPPDLDAQALLVTRVFALQSHCVFALWIGYGILFVGGALLEEAKQIPRWSGIGVMFLSIMPLYENLRSCSLAGFWFGYQYGYDMMMPLRQNSILLGGTDPGRFIPTYMIFCESQQPEADKTVPGFDRSEVYIITQNALVDRFYLDYLRRQYDARFRPTSYTPFERWLGRDRQYPRESIYIPDDEDHAQMLREFAQEAGMNSLLEVRGIAPVFDASARLAKLIFEKNKDRHTFYVEESLPMYWSYPHAVPDGLIMRLEKEPIPELPPEAIARDREFWDAYEQRLLNTPGFGAEPFAPRAFSKLRTSIGNLYAFRKLMPEAEAAYRQALRLCPENGESRERLILLLRGNRRYAEAIAEANKALALDRKNKHFWEILREVTREEALSEEAAHFRAEVDKLPNEIELRVRLIELYRELRWFDEYEKELRVLVGMPGISHQELMDAIDSLFRSGRVKEAIELLEVRREKVPNADVIFNLAAFYILDQQRDNSMARLKEAILLGGTNIQRAAKFDVRFGDFKTNAAFIELVDSPVEVLRASAAAATNAPPSQTPANAPLPSKKPARKR